jgi:histone H3/H4
MTDFLKKFMNPVGKNNAPGHDESADSEYMSDVNDDEPEETKYEEPEDTKDEEPEDTKEEVPTEVKTTTPPPAYASPPPAVRHKKKVRGIIANWSRGRVRSMMQKNGAVRISNRAAELGAYILEAIVKEGIEGAIIYSGMMDHQKRVTLRVSDVKQGYQRKLNTTLYA